MKFYTPYPGPRQRFITTISLLVFFCTGRAWGQDGYVVFPGAGMTLSLVIEAIEGQTGYLFIYNASLVDTSTEITLPAGNIMLSSALSLIAPQIGYNIFVRRNYIVINTAEPYPATDAVPNPQPRTSDSYRVSDRNRAGQASNPRPSTGPEPDSLTSSAPLPEVPQQHPSYSRRITADIYTPIRDRLPRWVVKTNVLYGAASLTPNAAVEYGFGSRHTIELSASYNRWKYKADIDNNDKLLHLIVRPEYRYWFCERYNGHYVGAHGFYANYNISGKTVPMLFKKEYRQRGFAVGAGVTYGYHWAFAKRWGAEFNIGIGAAYLDYDRFGCKTCSYDREPKTKTYFGPTRAGINLVFLIK